MKRMIVIALAAIAIASSATAAELPPGKWWRRPEIASTLQLSAPQQERLDAIFRDAATELIDIKADVDKLQLRLRGELEKSQLNRQEITAIASRLNEARGRLFGRELMMLVDMRAVLNDAQWTRLRSELDARREGMQHDRREGGMRPDGPMNRGPMNGGRNRPPMRRP